MRKAKANAGAGFAMILTIKLGSRAQLSERNGQVVAHDLEVGRSRQGAFICVHGLRQPALQHVSTTVADARTPPRLPDLVQRGEPSSKQEL